MRSIRRLIVNKKLVSNILVNQLLNRRKIYRSIFNYDSEKERILRRIKIGREVFYKDNIYISDFCDNLYNISLYEYSDISKIEITGSLCIDDISDRYSYFNLFGKDL